MFGVDLTVPVGRAVAAILRLGVLWTPLAHPRVDGPKAAAPKEPIVESEALR